VFSIRLSPKIAILCAVSEAEWRIVTRLRAGRSEVRNRQGQNLHTGFGFQPAFYVVSTGALSAGIKRQEREANHSTPSGTGLGMSGSIPPLKSHALMACSGRTLPFPVAVPIQFSSFLAALG
jgi:hypothetical protein